MAQFCLSMRWKRIAESFFVKVKSDDVAMECRLHKKAPSSLQNLALFIYPFFALICISSCTLNGFVFILRFVLDPPLHVLGLATGVRVGVN